MAPANGICFFLRHSSSGSNLPQHDRNTIRRDADERRLCCTLERRRTLLLPVKSKRRRVPRTSPSIFIISAQNKQLCKWSLKVTHSADFRWSSFKRPLCPLCASFFLINQAKATDEASLSVICRQEMNGYWELCPGLLCPVSSEDGYHWRGERQRQIRSPLRNSSGILTSDSQNTALSVSSSL